MDVQQVDSQLDATLVELEILAERLGMRVIETPLEGLVELRRQGLEAAVVVSLPGRWPVIVWRGR